MILVGVGFSPTLSKRKLNFVEFQKSVASAVVQYLDINLMITLQNCSEKGFYRHNNDFEDYFGAGKLTRSDLKSNFFGFCQGLNIAW